MDTRTETLDEDPVDSLQEGGCREVQGGFEGAYEEYSVVTCNSADVSLPLRRGGQADFWYRGKLTI